MRSFPFPAALALAVMATPACADPTYSKTDLLNWANAAIFPNHVGAVQPETLNPLVRAIINNSCNLNSAAGCKFGVGTSQYWTTPYAGQSIEGAWGTSGAPVTSVGPSVKFSRTEAVDPATCDGVTNNADCNATVAVYSWDTASSKIQGTALMAAAIGLQLTGPYNDTVGATFYAATYPSGATATPVFAGSGNTVSGLSSATFYVGTSVVFSVSGGSLPSGITAGVPYKILTTSGGVATIGRLNPGGGAVTQATWTGAGTGTQLATQGTSDNKATGVYCSAKTYSPDGRALCAEINVINISGTDPTYNAGDGDGFYGLLVSCGAGTFVDANYRDCGNAVQISNDGKSWLVGVSVTGSGVTYADFDAEATSSYGLLIGGNHTVAQIAGLNWAVGPTGDLVVQTPDSAQAVFASTGAHDAWIKVRNTVAGQQSYLDFVDGATDKWEIVKTSANAMLLWDVAAARAAFSVASASAFTLAASTTGSAGINLGQGVAPSSPVNGDVWVTSAGLYYRFNGTTHGPL